MGHQHRSERSGTWDPVADCVRSLIDSYLGKNYQNKRGKRTLGPFLRWLNAVFGASILLSAVYLRTFVALVTSELSTTSADFVGRLSTDLTAIGILGIAVVVGLLTGIVAASSIRQGGPLRLFIAGVFVSGLPFALAFRAPVDGG